MIARFASASVAAVWLAAAASAQAPGSAELNDYLNTKAGQGLARAAETGDLDGTFDGQEERKPGTTDGETVDATDGGLEKPEVSRSSKDAKVEVQPGGGPAHAHSESGVSSEKKTDWLAIGLGLASIAGGAALGAAVGGPIGAAIGALALPIIIGLIYALIKTIS